MLLSTENGALRERTGEQKAIELYARVGFDAIDYGFTPWLERGEMPWNRSGYAGYAREVSQIAEDNGIRFNQAHGPLAFDFGRLPDFDAEILPLNIRCMECCALMGIPQVVVHPLHFLPYPAERQRTWDMNMEYFHKLLPYAREFGVKIALENMFGRNARRGILSGDFLGCASEFGAFFDALNDPQFVCVVDTGHCTFTDETPGEMIRRMGSRVTGLHINDNLYRTDDHLVPGAGKIDWDDVVRALAETGYAGDMTLEVLWPYDAFDDTFLETAAKYLHDVGRYLIRKFEEYSARTDAAT